jgi:hypothetical protein
VTKVPFGFPKFTSTHCTDTRTHLLRRTERQGSRNPYQITRNFLLQVLLPQALLPQEEIGLGATACWLAYSWQNLATLWSFFSRIPKIQTWARLGVCEAFSEWLRMTTTCLMLLVGLTILPCLTQSTNIICMLLVPLVLACTQTWEARAQNVENHILYRCSSVEKEIYQSTF